VSLSLNDGWVLFGAIHRSVSRTNTGEDKDNGDYEDDDVGGSGS
jgi:hypothetical protein